MQDLKKNKRKMMNQQRDTMPIETNVEDNFEEVLLSEDISRGCRPKHDCHKEKDCECRPKHDCHKDNDCECRPKHDCHNDNDCDCNCNCNCNCNSNCCCDDHHDCDCDFTPCGMDSKTCFKNPCGPSCCDPITPERFSVANSVPFAIETNRIFDTMRFQTFTDATELDGDPLVFATEVVEVNGPIPRVGPVSVTIDKICINFNRIIIDTGKTSLEDFEVVPLDDTVGKNCETEFEFAVCGERNAPCCREGRGKSVAYKQRGLNVEVEDLVLELRGRCGCTDFIALAFPAVKKSGGKKCEVDRVRFTFNTLSSPICLPADGRGVTLRQTYQTNLTVDCIGKAFLSCECFEGESFFDLDIPNGIDLILCLQNTVSTLISDQIVVLGSPTLVQPRIVDTFAEVCDFRQCGPRMDENNKNRNRRNRDRDRDRDDDCKCR